MNLAYWKKLGERVLVAFAATLGGLLTAGGFDLLSAPWKQSLAASGMAALLALLASVAGGGLTTSDSPALTSKETETSVQ